MTLPACGAETRIREAVFCAVDVETSGLNMSSRLVEVGAVRFEPDGRSYEFRSLINPCENIDPRATAIHGITDRMARSAPRAGEVIPGLLDFVRGSVFVAHNAPFDVRMISNELFRMGEKPPDNQVLCTVSLARSSFPDSPNYRLGTLVDFLGIDVGSLHNALPDARAAMEVFIAATRGLPAETLVRDLPGFLGTFDAVAPPYPRREAFAGDIDELPTIATARLSIEMEYQTNIHRGPVVVTPLYLFAGTKHSYMKAYCHRDGIQKTYRIDRIVRFRIA